MQGKEEFDQHIFFRRVFFPDESLVLVPDSSNFVDPDTINPDSHRCLLYCFYVFIRIPNLLLCELCARHGNYMTGNMFNPF